jgi:DNA-binding transcriptional LysR family regulator
VHLEEHVSSAVAGAVADGSADFGIVSELPMISGISAVPFRTDLIVALQPSHPLARRSSISFAELGGQPFVGLHAGSSLHPLLTRAAEESGATPNWRIHVTSFDAACAMVAAGLGVNIVPRAASIPYVRSLALAALPLTDTWASRQLFLCARNEPPLQAAALALFEHLRTQP